LSERIDAGSALLGENAEIADQVLGGFEAIDVDNLGNQDSGCGYADAWNRGEVDVPGRRQVGIRRGPVPA
jgi:hypothetical protein